MSHYKHPSIQGISEIGLPSQFFLYPGIVYFIFVTMDGRHHFVSE